MEPIYLDFKSAIGGLDKQLHKLSAKNIKFACTRALTWTSGEIRDQLKRSLVGDLTLRTQYPAGTIRSRPAKNSDAMPTTSIGSTSYMMKELSLETGGEKRAKDPAKAMGVPILGGARPTASSIVTRDMWPGRLLARYKAHRAKGLNERHSAYQRGFKGAKAKAPYDYFVGPLNRGLQKQGSNGEQAVYKIVSRGTKVSFHGGRPHRVQSDKLKLMYVLKGKVPIPYKWHFADRVLSSLPNIWARNARKSLISELRDKGYRVN